MSMHKMRNTELDVALAKHRLPVDKPSQLSDSFRAGWFAHAEKQDNQVNNYKTILKTKEAYIADLEHTLSQLAQMLGVPQQQPDALLVKVKELSNEQNGG